ncbi:MAG TPA: hypothetical protein ENN34_00195 [Deltaproteobacteria bacterium]|nr:hypothetical protein [Deltaproteobacteria bacterium]
MSCLRSWRQIIRKQARSVEATSLDELRDLTSQASILQARIEEIIGTSAPGTIGEEAITLLGDISAEHAECLRMLQQGTDKLKSDLSRLKKNRASLNGYKQQPSRQPRIMSKLT